MTLSIINMILFEIAKIIDESSIFLDNPKNYINEGD